MPKIISAVKNFIVRRKIVSVIIVLAVIGVGFWIYKSFSGNATAVKYVLAKAEKGTIVSSLSSSGSISALAAIDLKAKASGDLVYVGVQLGDTVKAGKLIAMIDTTSAKQAIVTAQQNLQSVQISAQKLVGGDSANPRNKQEAQDALNKDYESGYNAVANVFIDLPGIITDINDILYGNDFNNYQDNVDYYSGAVYTFNDGIGQYKTGAEKAYKTAKDSYDKNFDDYKATSRFSVNSAVDAIILQTYETSKNTAQAIKDANNLIQFYKNVLSDNGIKSDAKADTALSLLNTDLGKINSAITNLLSSQNTIKNDKNSLVDADLDIKSQNLSLDKAQQALVDAEKSLGDYYVYAPFDGVISAVNYKAGESASGAIASLVTKTLVAEISFGETDIAKVKIGQKAALAFDALPDLTLTGKVSAIDVVGTSSQGVVSYNVKIVLDMQNDSVKPGMSTTAQVITDTKTDALYVPSSAVKRQAGSKYVMVVSEASAVPERVAVETGLSDSSSTEIISGLNEGDVVVQSTISSSTATSASSSPSRIRIPF